MASRSPLLAAFAAVVLGMPGLAHLFGFLRALLGLAEPAVRTHELVYASPDGFVGDTGEVTRGVCAARVCRASDRRPVNGIAVRYDILRGPATFEDGGSHVTRLTGGDGTAAVDVRFTGVGAVLVTARRVAAPDRVVTFVGQTAATTRALTLSGPATFAAEDGRVTVRITARDYRGMPVAGAPLALWANQDLDRVVEGRVREIGDGVYEGVLETTIAGTWLIGVEDRDSGAIGRHPVHALPGAPAEIRIVEAVDPRRNRPHSEAIVRATLVDRFGNALDPYRLNASVMGRPLPRTIVEPEARFTVFFPGYGRVVVRLWDGESAIAWDEVVEFAAASLDHPGPVMVGSRFRMPLHGFLPPGRPGQRAIIEIAFDAERTSFVGSDRDAAEPAVRATATVVSPDRVSIAVDAERVLTAEEFPDGVYVCTTEWACQAAGESCFDVTARMSPTTEPWQLCVDQKLPLTKNLCINVIYPPGKIEYKDAGLTVADEIRTVLASAANVERCCPILTYTWQTCEISAADWDRIIRTLGRPEIYSYPKFLELAALDLACKRSRCLNLIMIDFRDLNPTGQTLGREHEGTMAVDPAPIINKATQRYGGIHEIGHALGLRDLYTQGPGGGVTNPGPPGNLMSVPPGTNLTEEQCQIIWSHLDKYTG